MFDIAIEIVSVTGSFDATHTLESMFKQWTTIIMMNIIQGRSFHLRRRDERQMVRNDGLAT